MYGFLQGIHIVALRANLLNSNIYIKISVRISPICMDFVKTYSHYSHASVFYM